MKYIRTKDNIIDNIILNLCDGVLSPQTLGYEVIKQADNLEELFSAIVLKGVDIIFLNKEHTQYHFEGSDEWFDIIDTELRMGIYGAIWTDKGLIYVAKLNDKKEFELL